MCTAPVRASPAGGMRLLRLKGKVQYRGQPAHERETLNAEASESGGHGIDVFRGRSHELACRGVVSLRVLDDYWRKTSVVAWVGPAHPTHDRIRIATEPLKHCAATRSTSGRHGPTNSANGFTAEPGAAALVRDGKAPTSDAIFALSHGPADTAGADDDDASVAATVRAHTGGPRVTAEGHLQTDACCRAALSVTGSQAPARARQATIWASSLKTSLLQALIGGSTDCKKALFQSQTNVGRSGNSLPERSPRHITKPGTTPRATAVNSKQKEAFSHVGAPISGPNS